jgi:hypothetical protein
LRIPPIRHEGPIYYDRQGKTSEKGGACDHEKPHLAKPWLAHYEAGVPEHVQYENICLPEYLKRSAEAFPDKMALTFQGYR